MAVMFKAVYKAEERAREKHSVLLERSRKLRRENGWGEAFDSWHFAGRVAKAERKKRRLATLA
jgi:hypothetical protein